VIQVLFSLIFFNFFFLFRFLFFFFFSFSFSLHSRHRKKQGRLEERGRREEENEKEKKKVTIRMKVKKNKKVVAVKSSDFFFLFFFARALPQRLILSHLSTMAKKKKEQLWSQGSKADNSVFSISLHGDLACVGTARKKKVNETSRLSLPTTHTRGKGKRKKEKGKRKKGTSLCLFLPPRRKKKVKKGTDRGNCFSFLGSLRHKN